VLLKYYELRRLGWALISARSRFLGNEDAQEFADVRRHLLDGTGRSGDVSYLDAFAFRVTQIYKRIHQQTHDASFVSLSFS
jgi:hypothetical protein